MALEVGLTPTQFWYGDLYLLDAYVKAYNNKTKNNAILFGMYTNIAVRTAIASCFGEKEGNNYLKEIEDMEKQVKSDKMSKQEKTEQFNKKVNFWATLKSRMGN